MEPSTENSSDMDVQEELKRFKEENSMLNRRLLGVNELARLLQEKTEFSNSLQEKNKRLEIAVVRLENRCSNIEKKAKTGQYSSLPSNAGAANPKSLPNSPFIPGPSRQILESLMKDNHELKKTINSLIKGGPVGYKEAVKMNHLEEVIDQKNEKIDLLQKQIENLTASHDEQGSVDPGLLKRQLLKMEQAMKVKDRFCTLLSDRVSQLERELSSGREGTDGDDETEDLKSKGDSDLPTDPSHLIRELELKEKKCRKVIDELQSQVEKERNEKKDLLSSAEDSERKVSSLESEIVSLNRKVESLSTYNNTLVSEKMDLSGDVMRLNDKLQQHQNELKKMDEEFQRKSSEMQEKIEDLEDDNGALQNQLYEARFKLGELANKQSGTAASWAQHILSSGPGIGTMSNPRTRAYDPLGNRGKPVLVDGPGPRVRSSPEPQQQHCGSSIVPQYVHRELLASRDVGTDGNNAESTVSATVTTPTVTPSNASTRSLDLSSQQQFQRYRSPQTPGQYPPAPVANQQYGSPDPSIWQQQQQQHFPPRSQVLPMNQVNQPSMSLPPHSNVPQYHVSGMPPSHQSPYAGTVFGPQFGATNAGNPGIYHTPGSGYMTHPTEYPQRYYGGSPQPPIQRRQSPPSQHSSNASGSSNQQHYHTGQQ